MINLPISRYNRICSGFKPRTEKLSRTIAFQYVNRILCNHWIITISSMRWRSMQLPPGLLLHPANQWDEQPSNFVLCPHDIFIIVQSDAWNITHWNLIIIRVLFLLKNHLIIRVIIFWTDWKGVLTRNHTYNLLLTMPTFYYFSYLNWQPRRRILLVNLLIIISGLLSETLSIA